MKRRIRCRQKAATSGRTPAERVPTWRLHRPPELDDPKRLDARRYRAGRPNLFDTG